MIYCRTHGVVCSECGCAVSRLLVATSHHDAKETCRKTGESVRDYVVVSLRSRTTAREPQMPSPSRHPHCWQRGATLNFVTAARSGAAQ